MDSKNETIKKIKSIISDQLGIDPDDVQDDYSLKEDLHMGPAELTDLSENLQANGFDITDIDFRQIESVSELIDAIILTEI